MSKFLPINLSIRQALLYPLTFPFLPPVNKVEKDHKYAAGRLTGTLEAPPAQGIPKTGQTIKYRDGDDGDLEKGYPVTPPRFTDNEDGTITDNATGLMWAKDGNGPGCNNGNTKLWAAAIDWAVGLTFAGHNDWRLPNVKELHSIVDIGGHHPAINETFFPNTTDDYYYTSSTYLQTTTRAWAINFTDAIISHRTKATSYEDVRVVRLGVGS